ncbi:MAG: ROK family protein [Paenibacillaceae bacterium]
MSIMGYFIGLDVGGTHIVGGLLGEDGSPLHTLKIHTEAAKGTEFLLDHMAGLIGRLLEERGVGEHAALKAVGIGIPGFIHPAEGLVKLAANLPLTNIRVADEIRSRIGVPVYIHNDVKMIVYGEAIQGAGRGYDHVLGITLGTGLASAFVDHGKLLVGSGDLAGEIGHVRMEGIPYTCGCGMQGCLETIASATGIVRQAIDALEEGRRSVLAEWFPLNNRTALTAKDVTRAYDAGDPLATEIMSHTGTLLGKALAFATVLYSPDVIIVGGGVALAGERLLQPIRETLFAHVHPFYRERIQVVTPALHDQAGVIGSAEYARMMLQ